MSEDTDTDDGSGNDGGDDKFTPESLSKEAQEYIRVQIQSESDRKEKATETRLRAETADKERAATQVAEQNEIDKLAESGDYETLGMKVAEQRSRQSVSDKAVVETSNFIEKQLVDSFTENLGADVVEEVRQEVMDKGGAHAELAQALAEKLSSKTKAEDIAAEAEAILISRGLVTREQLGGADKVSKLGGGTKPSDKAELQQAYIDGKPGADKQYRDSEKAKNE